MQLCCVRHVEFRRRILRGDDSSGAALPAQRRVAHPCLFSVLENQLVFNEARIPFSLTDLPDGEELPLHDVDAFIPYLLERWPAAARPHHIELLQADGRKPPAGTDGWVVFRLAAPEKEPEHDPDGGPVIDWDKVLKQRLADRPPGDGG